MIQAFIRYMKGYVKLRVNGYSPERFLNMCRYHNIYIWGLTPTQNAYEMYVSLKGFYRLKPIIRKTHTRVNVTGRYGFPFFAHRYRKRKLFFAGIAVCAVLLYLYSGFIWDIHFEGNERWTDENLSEFLASMDVAPLMRKSKVDCPEIVSEIRKAYNDIVWVSASIDGTCLKIHVKENEDHFETEEAKADTETYSENGGTGSEAGSNGEAKDLVAAKDGVITEIVTRSGVPQVHVGDTVSKGDILVSGRVEVLNDSGEVINYQYCVSDADIFADTVMEYSDTMPLTYQEKQYDKKHRTQYYLRLGGWQFSVGSIKNSYKNAEILTSETQMKAGENFYLPVVYGTKTVKSYAFQEKNYTKKELQEALSANFQQFCGELEEKGIQITENSVKIHIDENSADASGTLYLNERITEYADTERLPIERIEQDESGGTDYGNTG